MKTLIFGAGPIGSVYAYLLHKAGKDVTLLARNKTFDFIKKNGLVLFNEFTGKTDTVNVKVVDKLEENDAYDLVVVAIRKNKVHTVLPVLSRNQHIKNILFIGNNALGFDAYLEHLPKEKVLFGFGRAGGGRKEHVVHYVDSEKPNGKRMSLIVGEIDGEMRERTERIKTLFESAEIPVEVVKDIDGWLKYHIAMVLPMCAALLNSDCDNQRLAGNKEDVRRCLRGTKEAGNVLAVLGYTKRQPFKLNLFYWMPEFLVVKIIQQILISKFAEIAFALHVRAATDEFKEHADDFKTLVDKTSVKTPNLDRLRNYFS
ncbi:MAG: ketopantoate reductase family protein [bacterium]|nr:ketopantoate reductase family protein [bacterium]